MRLLCLSFLLCLNAVLAMPQAQTQESGGQRPPGEKIVGKVTSVNKDFLTVAPLGGNGPVTIKIGANTRVTRQRRRIKVEEIKADDVVFVRGQIEGNAVEAGVVSIVPPKMVQRFQQGIGGAQGNREDMGKRFIHGQRTSVRPSS